MISNNDKLKYTYDIKIKIGLRQLMEDNCLNPIYLFFSFHMYFIFSWTWLAVHRQCFSSG